jgi:O-antigen ligase
MTASRGGVAGMVIGAAIGALYLRKYISTKHFTMAFAAILLVGPIAVGALYLGGFGDLFYERFIELSGSRNSWALSSGRTEIWSTALAKMFEQPISIITGFGWDSYRQAFIFRYAPHNTYLKFFFELGGIGLLLIIAALVNVVRTARRGISEHDKAKSTMLFAFIFGFLGMLMAIFFVDLTSPWILIWAFVGITMRLSQPQAESVGVASGPSAKGGRARHVNPRLAGSG